MDQAMVIESLRGLGPFAIYVGLSLGLMALFSALYQFATVHNEWALIRSNNLAAAIAFSGALVGYALALVAAATNARALGEFLIWAVIAIVVQILVYWFFRALMLPDVSARIERGEVAAGVVLCTASIVGGLIVSGAMAI
jgi:putative membrane protein